MIIGASFTGFEMITLAIVISVVQWDKMITEIKGCKKYLISKRILWLCEQSEESSKTFPKLTQSLEALLVIITCHILKKQASKQTNNNKNNKKKKKKNTHSFSSEGLGWV